MRKNFTASIALLIFGCTSPAASQVFQELYSFEPFGTNGDGPYGGLIQARDHNYYGTTFYGGAWDCGTLYKMTTNGVLTIIASFNGTTTDQHPITQLVEANDGSFYGATVYPSRIFEATPDGTLTSAGGGIGTIMSPILQARDGCLYVVDMGDPAAYAGTDSIYDGSISRFNEGGGPGGGVYQFARASHPENGYYPSGGLVQAPDGNFYGVTSEGGAYGYGVAYRLTTNGNYAVLCSFSRGPALNDAVYPYGRLLLASDGNLYGVAGAYYEDGYLFRLTTNGVLTTLVRFGTWDAQGQLVWGQTPNAGLIEANDGNFYGTTMYGGDPRFWPTGLGTVFRVTPAGVVTTIVSFTETGGPYPGATPHAGLLQASDGNLYGTTANAGSRGAGNIFRIIMPGPLLSVAAAGAGQVVLSWRTNYQGYGLQSSPDLQPPNWSPCTNAPVVVGHHYYVTNSLTGPARFFRLQK
ncbi:MAG TPA: choice-of-anchor tandem repeat GloVer-containing protein [Verrucomicrobiae bacterium]|nr:choice-of-anchor tandem repeat GloVer-containing protein [Verrucomicrobiae bacterium]